MIHFYDIYLAIRLLRYSLSNKVNISNIVFCYFNCSFCRRRAFLIPIEKSFNHLRLDIPAYGNKIKSIFFTFKMWIKILTIQIELYEDERSLYNSDD